MTDAELKETIKQARADQKELRKLNPALLRVLQKLEKRIIKLEQENRR